MKSHCTRGENCTFSHNEEVVEAELERLEITVKMTEQQRRGQLMFDLGKGKGKGKVREEEEEGKGKGRSRRSTEERGSWTWQDSSWSQSEGKPNWHPTHPRHNWSPWTPEECESHVRRGDKLDDPETQAFYDYQLSTVRWKGNKSKEDKDEQVARELQEKEFHEAAGLGADRSSPGASGSGRGHDRGGAGQEEEGQRGRTMQAPEREGRQRSASVVRHRVRPNLKQLAVAKAMRAQEGPRGQAWLLQRGAKAFCSAHRIRSHHHVRI